MLEGLEVSIVNLKQAVGVSDDYRWDSEYYGKVYLKNVEVIHHLPTDKLKSLTSFIKKGIFDLPPTYYLKEGVPLIRTSEIKDPTVDFSSTVFISDKVNEDNYKTSLQPNDLVFTKIGAYIGDVAMLPSNYKKYNFSQNVAGAKLKSSKDGPYLLSFLLSKIGRNQILRSSMLSGQGKLELDDIRNYEIPQVSGDFKAAVASIFKQKEELYNLSVSSYSKAEHLLLQAIGLNNFKPTTKNTNEKKVSQSFAQSGRLDAEYYLPKYEEVVLKIKSTPYETLKGLAHIKKSIEPGSVYYSEEGIPFLRVSDYSKVGFNAPGIKLNKNFERDYAGLVSGLKPKKDTILLSKDGSVGVAYKVENDLDAITSSAILHLKVKETKTVLPDYLTLALNSPLTQLQAERDAGGSIILHWRVSEIENVLIPVIDYKIQQQITELIQKCFALKKQSQELLQKAKQAVEVAIEDGEAKGLALLK